MRIYFPESPQKLQEWIKIQRNVCQVIFTCMLVVGVVELFTLLAFSHST
jgi:hypothetical protein